MSHQGDEIRKHVSRAHEPPAAVVGDLPQPVPQRRVGDGKQFCSIRTIQGTQHAHFDKTATGQTTCQACAANDDCPAGAPNCRYGYCEVN